MALNEHEENILRNLMEQHGVARVLEAMSRVCFAKGDGDDAQAKMWRRNGKLLAFGAIETVQ